MRNQYLSRPDVQNYLTQYPDVTKEEKGGLLQWLKQGYSLYCNNRYVFDENDRPLDFIGAIRAEKEYYEDQYSIRFGEKNTECVTFCSVQLRAICAFEGD